MNNGSQIPIVDYNEFGFLEAISVEEGLEWRGPPRVSRRNLALDSGQTISMIVWGTAPPELVLLHGGGQNAHTWDTLTLMLRRPVVAIDLPGHGHSSWRPDRDYSPWTNAEAIARILPEVAPEAHAVIGMSLGGATVIRLAATRPDLVRKAVIIDVTPGVSKATTAMTREDRGAVALISDPPSYEDFDAMVAAAVALSPNRSPEAVARGVRHNALKLPDGRWRWRYDLFGPAASGQTHDIGRLWDDVSRISAPSMLVLGGQSKFVAADHKLEMERRLPSLRVATVPNAGHAVQSDQPRALAELIEDFVFGG